MRTNFVQTCKTSANRINLNRTAMRVALIGLFISLGIGNAWAHDNHTGKVTLVNATGNGTVYLSTSNTENTGQSSSSNPGAKNGTSVVTWSCGSSSSGDSKTLYPRGTGNAGYYYLGYATTNNATSGYSTAGKSFSAQSDTDTKIYGYFAEITINNGTASPATIAAEDNSATATTNTCTVTYATKGDNMNDFAGATVGGATGHGSFTAALGSVTSAGAATVNVTFKGDGTYGGNVAAGSRSRTSTAVVTLTSVVGNNKGTCTVTASFPNIVIGDGSFDHMSTINTVPKSATATFPVQWADDELDFSASFGSVTGGGEWTVNEPLRYNATDGTISIDYTFNPNGAIGDHSAVLTLSANDNAGGASKTLTLTAEAEKHAENDAVVISGGSETEYETLAAAITAANALSTNPTIKILRNVEGLTSTLEIKKPMTIDLNSFTVSGTLTSSVTKLFYLNTDNAVLTINDSRNGGKISATGDNNAILYTVLVDKGSLVLTKGDIEMNNTNTGGTAKANAVRIKAGARFAMAGGNLTATTAGSYAYGLFVTTNPSDANMIAVSGGTITATAAQTLGIGVYCQSSSATPAADPNNANVILDGVTVNASTTGTTDAYAVQTDAGVILGINNGTYNATAATTTARALLTSGYTVVVNGTFNAVSGASNANAIRVEAGITAVRNGAFSATAQTHAANASVVASGAKLLTYGGTFHGKLENVAKDKNATGVYVNGTLEAQGGTFIGEAANSGLAAAQTSVAAGVYANTGSNVTLANATLRGLTDNTYVNGAYALYTSTVNPVSLTNCTLEATSTYQYGYGIYNNGSSLTANNCEITVNTTYAYNYGVYNNSATANTEMVHSTITCTSGTTYAYGANVLNGTLTATDCTFSAETKHTGATSAGNCQLFGINVASGKTATLTGCTINTTGSGTYSNNGYGIYVDGSVDVTDCEVTVSNINSGAYAICNTANTTAINVYSGKFKATATSTGIESNATAAATKQQLYGGFYVHNNNLAKYLPEGYMIETLTAGTEFNAGYKYHVRPETVVNDPVCKIGSVGYATLEEALEFVNKNSNTAYIIYMVKNYTLPAGDYTLPAKATLLVPYKDGQTTAIGTTPSRADSYATRSPYRTLTFASGAKMTVYGTIEASAQQNRTDQTSSGEVRGPFGYIILNENASITLEKNAVLIAWGFVCGKGTITVKDGAKAYEMLSLGWYKGGNTTLKLYNNESYKVFVMTDYAYQNIECAITYHPGAQALAAASTDYFSPNDVELVGTSTTSFFKMVKEEASADTWVRKEYDPKTDYTTWTMNNGASMSAIKLDSYSSENFYLPITSNFRIVLNYGEMTLGGDIEFHAGAELIIKKEATGKIASGKTVVFYDGDDWRTGLGSSGKYYYPVTYSPSWKAATGATTNPRLAKYKQLSTSTAPNYLPDAALFVQGKLEVSGNLYTTGDGNKVTAYRNSNIYSSNDDAGKIIYKTTAPASSATKTMYKCTAMYGVSSGKGIKDMLANGNSTAYPALLQNGDGTYETTGGTAANSSWIYKNDHWVMVTTEGCFSVEQISGVKHYYAYPAGFVEVSSNIEDANHLYTDAATGNRRFLVDNDCVWWEVEPTPYDGNKYKCVTPDHNGKYKYYEYVSGWQEATVTVTWSINGTNTNYTVLYGTHPKYLSASPSKASTTTDYYTWLGWTKGSESGEFFAKDAELPVATENTTYYAYFKADKFTFRATFNNYDGSLLETKLVAVGETPVYEGETPVKPATTSKEYTFTGWSPALAAISNEPVTYTAQFSEKTREYTITWANYDGTVLKTEKVAYGTKPSAPTVTPTRPNDDYYTYTFDAWSPAIASVGGDQTYTATYNYEALVPKYTATFKSGSETVYAPSLKSGEVPVFDGTTPTKTADAQYTYTFDGWSTTDGGALAYASGDALPALTADVTYYAHFATTTNAYTIRWKSEDGKVLYETDNDVPYGITPSFDSTDPTKPRMGATVYTFDGWSATIGGAKIALPQVTGNATYYAHFSDLPVYTVTFDAKGHGTAPSSQEVEENQHVIEPAAPAAAEWIFGGWYKEAECTNVWNFASDVVTANRTLYAKWTPAVASVTVNSATTYYATIDDAFTAANNATAASTLTLLQDVTVTTKLTYNNSNNKDCILDLNGHTLTSNTSEQSPLHINNTSVTFTITDGTVEKAGKLSLNSSFSTKAIFGAFVDNGTLLLNAGTIEVTSSTANTCGVTANSNGTFTMNGGTIHVKATNSSKEGRGVYSVGSATINDGTVHVEAAGDGYGIKRDGGTVTVNNGKFNISGSTANVTTQTSANANVVIRGGYYTTNSQLYPTAPYHVFGLDNQSPYLYEVAEGYTLTWTTDGDPLTGTYTSGVTKPGTTIVQPATPTKTGYTFSAWSPAVAETMPVEDTEYTATWTPNTNTAYAVKHYQQNLADDEYTLFETDNLTGTTDAATEAIAKSYTGFTAQSFSQSTIAPDGSTTVSIYYNRDKFTITWNNADGSTLETDANVKYGALPAYDGTTPTKTTDAEYAYAFNGWSPAVSAVTADATYTATYTTTPVVASLTVNSSGNKYYYTDFSEAFNIAKNSVPVTITLLRDASCSEALVYNGSNTDCTLDLNGHTLTGTPSAQLILNINKAGSTFTITDGSANHDGKLSFSSESESTSHCVIVNNGTFVLEEGTLEATSSTASIGAVKVAGGTFTMNENGAVHAKYTGNVSGKNSRLVNATGGTTNINGGTIHLESTSDAIGVVYSSGTVTITGGNFKIEAGGTAAVTNQTGANNSLNIRGGYYSANSTGYFQPHVKIPYHIFSNSDETYIYRVAEAYTITFVDGDGNTLLNPATTNNLWKKGETPAYTGSTPTKSTDAQYTYTFTGWSPVITTVTEAATYTAQFSSTPRTYTVTLNTNDGTINAGDVTEYTYGTGATLPTDVTKDGYEFGGWFDNSGLTGDAVTTISTTETGNKEYWAKWTASIVDRELDIVDWTSNSITINVTNLKAESGTNKNNWTIRVNGVDYTKSNCNTTTRTLTVSGLSLTPNENLLIQLKNDADVIESQHNYKIPQIYNAENATLSGTTEESVVYVYGGKLTISGDAALAALYVCPGAEVEVTDGNTLTVGKLVLRTKPWATAAISGNVTAANVYYTRIAPDGSSEYPTGQYYQFGLPYECAISAVRLSDGTTPAYNTTWILKNYDEESRATNGATGENWDVLSSGTIAAGRGYEMFSSYKYYREYYFPVTPTENTSVAVTRHGDDKNNSGWNIVCSPLMSVYTQSPAPEGMTVSWLQQDGSYWQLPVEEIKPAIPFSYQATETGYITFGENIGLSALAPRRVTASEEQVRIQWLQLDVEAADGKTDQTSIYSHPTRYEQTYKTGIDVAKQSLTASRALIYSLHAYGEMAFAGVADALLEQGVALTVYSPKEQELTISMRKNDWLNRMAYVWLIDQATGAQIDLLESDYSFNAEAGTTAGRFILMGAFFAPQITTDNGNVQSDDEHIKVTKFIYNDKMYIQINGVIYDATGKLVK